MDTHVVGKEARRLAASTRALDYRRINWRVHVRHVVRNSFDDVAHRARASGYPFRLRVTEYETPNEGTVQLVADMNMTGAVDRKSRFDLEEFKEIHIDTHVRETGGALVASQSVSGFIHFIAYPYTSDRIRAVPKQIFLAGPLHPNDVSPRLLRRMVRRYLLILRRSTVFGGTQALTWPEHARYWWIRLMDVRTKYRLGFEILTLKNSWANVLAGAIAGWVAGYFSGK